MKSKKSSDIIKDTVAATEVQAVYITGGVNDNIPNVVPVFLNIFILILLI